MTSIMLSNMNPIRRGFAALLADLAPTNSEQVRYDGHRKTIERRLATAFAGTQVQPFGSHSRGTAIRGESDLDLLAVLPRDALRWGGQYVSSDTALRNIRSELDDRYSATPVGKDGQAILVGFGSGGYDVDVVPAYFREIAFVPVLGANRPVYAIPDGEGGWLKTSPAAHADYIANEDHRTGGKLKYVARLLKHWRFNRSVAIPIQSFHVELVLAESAICVGPKSYAECLADAFAHLSRRRCAAIRDPLGISGLIMAAGTVAKRSAVEGAIGYAAEHAARAVAAERRGQLAQAASQWGLVFNQNLGW